MSNPFNWYHWTDEENMQGPYSTKEEAIEAGREEHETNFGVGYYCRAQLNFDIDFDRIISDIEEQNAERLGVDGVIFDVVSKEQLDKLEKDMQAVMDKFVSDNPKLMEAAWSLLRSPKVEDQWIEHKPEE